MSIAAKSARRVREEPRGRPFREAWLNTRAQEIIEQNPGAAFPEHDQEFADETLAFIRQNVMARIRGESFALFDGDDLTQECWLRVLKFFPQFRGEGFRVWIYKIVQSAFYSMLKVDRHTATVSVDEMDSAHNSDGQSREEAFVDDVDFTEEADAARVITDFLVWLNRRNAKHAKILELQLDGWEPGEIAKRLGVAPSTVRSVLQRAPIHYQRFLGRAQKERFKRRQE